MDYTNIRNHLRFSTPQKLVNENFNTVWQGDYFAFGNVNETVNTVENNLRFPGQYFYSETGFFYNFHRYYVPDIGRYLREDPVRNGLNYYLYVNGNPVIYFDVNGFEILCRNIISSTSVSFWYISYEGGSGILVCTICGKRVCFKYSFACPGGGLGTKFSWSDNGEVGWWRGRNIGDFSGFSIQVSDGLSLLRGGTGSYVGGLFHGRGASEGDTLGFGAGGSLTLCITRNVHRVKCRDVWDK